MYLLYTSLYCCGQRTRSDVRNLSNKWAASCLHASVSADHINILHGSTLWSLSHPAVLMGCTTLSRAAEEDIAKCTEELTDAEIEGILHITKTLRVTAFLPG